MDTHIWYGLDVSYSYKQVCDFFDSWGCGIKEHTERFSNVEEVALMICKPGKLRASSVEDLPERLIIAANDYGHGSGEMLVLEPIRPER